MANVKATHGHPLVVYNATGIHVSPSCTYSIRTASVYLLFPPTDFASQPKRTFPQYEKCIYYMSCSTTCEELNTLHRRRTPADFREVLLTPSSLRGTTTRVVKIKK